MADQLSAGLTAWSDVAAGLEWARPYDTLFVERPPYHDWFVGGEFNLAVNCTERHLAGRGEQVAVYWEGEPGDRRSLTYQQLHEEVVRLATALRGMGVGREDRVALHLGWLPETVAAMLACAWIGAEYTVIPAALPVEALSLRLADFRPRVLFTQDGGWRHGAILPMKARVDEALEASSGVQDTVVVRRTGVQVDWFEGDLWYHDVLGSVGPTSVPAEALPAQHPLVSVPLANHRGRPVAVRLGAANLAAVALADHHYVMCEGEVFWGAADIAWLGGQQHGVFGPLLAGASAVMYEGTLDVPEPARAWQIVERYAVTSLMTSPSIVRALRSWSLSVPKGTGSLRRLVTIGDRLDQDLRDWLSQMLGDEVTVADGWGQVELGGIVTCDRPIDRSRMPDPRFQILDETGNRVRDGEAGEWVMMSPWAGTMRDVDCVGPDPTAYHWTRHPGHYATGDLARRDDSGRVEFLGRLDEVTSVSGQLVSLTEVRDALLEQPFVADAEVFERADPRLGRSVAAAVVLHTDAPTDAVALRGLQDGVRDLLGGLSRPRTLLVLDRIGTELDRPARQRGLAAIASAALRETQPVTWEQVVAAASTADTRR